MDELLERRLDAIDTKLDEMYTVIFGPPGNPLPTGLRGMMARVIEKVEQTERQRVLDRESENEREKRILEKLDELQTSRNVSRGGWRVVKEIGAALGILFTGIGVAAAVVTLVTQIVRHW